MPVVFSEVGQEVALLRQQRPVEDDRRRPEVEADQPGPDADDLRVRRRASANTSTRTAPSRRSAASSTPWRRRTTDINRIWAGTDDGLIHTTADGGLRWNDVTPPALDAVGEGVDHRRRTLRPAHRLRRGQHAPARRPAAAHLQHARRRQDVDGNRHRHSRRRDRQRGARGSEEEGAALCRHRARGLRLVRRRRRTGSRCG